MKAELISVTDQFPHLRGKILSLYEECKEFRAFCGNYFLCLRSLDQWTSKMRNAEKFVQGYSELKDTLENEMRRLIEKKTRAT